MVSGRVGNLSRWEGKAEEEPKLITYHFPLITIHHPLSTIHYPLSTIHHHSLTQPRDRLSDPGFCVGVFGEGGGFADGIQGLEDFLAGVAEGE